MSKFVSFIDRQVIKKSIIIGFEKYERDDKYGLKLYLDKSKYEYPYIWWSFDSEEDRDVMYKSLDEVVNND